MTNKENLKKQIIYRSTHRGTKEMDLLLGSFVRKNINNLNDLELKDLDNLMHIEDEILQKWYLNQDANTSVPVNYITKKLKEFKL